MPRPKKRKCLIRECRNEEIKSRGLCRSCYDAAAQLVRDGRTTWAQLEAGGFALPAYCDMNSVNPATRAIAEAGLLSNDNAPSST